MFFDNIIVGFVIIDLRDLINSTEFIILRPGRFVIRRQ